MDKTQFQELTAKLDTIIRLLALNAIKEKDLKEQVLVLSSFGFQPKQIADILDKNRSTVRRLLHRARKESEQIRGSAASQTQEG